MTRSIDDEIINRELPIKMTVGITNHHGMPIVRLRKEFTPSNMLFKAIVNNTLLGVGYIVVKLDAGDYLTFRQKLISSGILIKDKKNKFVFNDFFIDK